MFFDIIFCLIREPGKGFLVSMPQRKYRKRRTSDEDEEGEGQGGEGEKNPEDDVM